MTVQPRVRTIKLQYYIADDRTIRLTHVQLGSTERIDTPTLTMDNETSWFIEGEGQEDGDVIMLTLVRDTTRAAQEQAIASMEVEGMFASRKRVEALAFKSGHRLTSWDPIDKQTAGQNWIGATCLICARVLELEPIAGTPERVAHYKPRTSFHLRKCQLQS